ncbi:hypothetical protein ILUMI_13950 [Ignelater luminosus]|uniref:Uncharacterized protein n=1 Tax=Ignelater luminosus TaxID=2038154 RepID=A0A8K0CRE0_IGNLU|nr:hypothetical protein ILUMI_13950 [Ignelater luminosus]
MDCIYFVFVAIMAFATIVSSKPIMVSFGTNQGPIVPPPTTTIKPPQIQDRRAPAPVRESSDDIPNPSVYKPLVPQQYRNRIFSFRPNPNLILGTAQDQKYLGSSGKFNLLKQQQARAIGLDYRGPQFFEAQEYELDKLRQQQAGALPKQLFQPIMQPYQTRRVDTPRNLVPEIGIIYSSGLRYYVPQFGYDDNNDDSRENSVYSKNEAKYFY